MTLALRQIRFTPLRADGVGAPTIMTGYYIIQPTAAYDDGVGRVEPLPFQVDVDGASALVDLAATPVGNAWVWKVSGFFPDGGTVYTTVEYIIVPAGAYSTVLDFEDLTRLDPATLGPVSTVTSAVELRIQALEAAVANGAVTGGAPAGSGIGGRIKVGDLFDVTTVGIGVGTAGSATAGRTVLSAAALVHLHVVGDITATGTASATTFLRGDGAWASPSVTQDARLTEVENAVTALTTRVGTTETSIATINTALGTAFYVVVPSAGVFPARPATTRHLAFLSSTVTPTLDGSVAGGGGMVPNYDIWIRALA